MQIWPIQLKINELSPILRYSFKATVNAIVSYSNFTEIADITACWQDYGAQNRSHHPFHLWNQPLTP